MAGRSLKGTKSFENLKHLIKRHEEAVVWGA